MISLLNNLAPLAMRSALSHLAGSVGIAGVSQSAQSVGEFVRGRFSSHHGELGQVFQLSADRAWRSLELALAGESWWTWLSSRGEDKAFRGELRVFLTSQPHLSVGDSLDEAKRKRALREIRAARRQGLIPGGLPDRERLTAATVGLVVLHDPALRAKQEFTHLGEVCRELRERDWVALAEVLEVRPGDEADGLLVQSLRYFFDREVLARPSLRDWMTLKQLDTIRDEQRDGLDSLHAALTDQGDTLTRLLDIFDEVAAMHDVLTDVRKSVRNIERIVTAPAPIPAPTLTRPERTERPTTLPQPSATPIVVEATDAPVRSDSAKVFGLLPIWSSMAQVGHFDRVAFSADGHAMLLAGVDKTIALRHTATGELKTVFRHHAARVAAVGFSPDGVTAASVDVGGEGTLFSVPEGRSRGIFRIDGAARSLTFLADGETLAVETDNGTRWIDVGTKRACEAVADFVPPRKREIGVEIPHMDSAVMLCELSPDGRFVAVSCDDGEFQVYLRHTSPSDPDWTSEKPKLPPRAIARVSAGNGGRAHAGDELVVRVEVENSGRGPLSRVWAGFRCEVGSLASAVVPLGRIEPLAKAAGEVRVVLPISLKPGKLRATLCVSADHDCSPVDLPMDVAIVPRSDFDISWKLRDGLPPHAPRSGRTIKPGDCVDLVVSARCAVEGFAGSLLGQVWGLRLPTGLRIAAETFGLTEVAGGRREGIVTLVRERDGERGPVRLEVTIGPAEDARVFGSATIALDAG